MSLDPQGGCAVSLGISTDSLDKTVYNAALMRDSVRLEDIVLKTDHGFHLAPSNIDLASAEVELKQMLAAEQILKRSLEPVLDQYDYILFDCSPSLGILTINVLTAARELLIPMSMEFLALWFLPPPEARPAHLQHHGRTPRLPQTHPEPLSEEEIKRTAASIFDCWTACVRKIHTHSRIPRFTSVAI